MNLIYQKSSVGYPWYYFQEYPFEANDVKLSLDKVTHCAYFWAFYVKERNFIP